MKKKIIRLTENDLHNIIENVVNRMLKEDVQLDNFDYVNDILNASYIGSCDIKFSNSTYGEGELEVIGESGINYNIKCFVTGEYTIGMKSQDYDVPDDYDETDEKISDLEITYYDEDTNEWVELSREIEDNEDIKYMVMNHIKFDWSDYDPYDDYYE